MATPTGFRLNGPALKEIRRAKGLSVTETAIEVGVTQGTWSNYEAGRRNASLAVVKRITEVLMITDARAILWPDTSYVLVDRSAAGAA